MSWNLHFERQVNLGPEIVKRQKQSYATTSLHHQHEQDNKSTINNTKSDGEGMRRKTVWYKNNLGSGTTNIYRVSTAPGGALPIPGYTGMLG